MQCGIDDISSITIVDLEELINKNSDIQLIDVRNKDEYEQFNFKQAMHIPLHQIENQKASINFEKEIYVLCASGIRSIKAIELLREYNPDSTFINIKGGLKNYGSIAG